MNNCLILIAGMLFTLLTGLSLILFYLRYRRQLTRQELAISRAETKHQRDLLHAVIRSQENERRRIGMNLHDDVGAALSGLRILLQHPENPENRFSAECKKIIDRVIVDVRNISHDLSPLQTGAYEFTDALEDRCDSINRSEKIRVDLDCQMEQQDFGLNESEALALFRVISELLNNTIRHANANQVKISMAGNPSGWKIEYHDDGIGIGKKNAAKKGMGIQNIESRLQMIGAKYRMAAREERGFRMLIEKKHEEKILLSQ